MSDRECMEYDVVIVGAGPAGLACAIHLKQIDASCHVCVIEKASEIGAHILSGAVLEPQALDQLLPGWREQPPSPCTPAKGDQFFRLTKTGKLHLPTPPQINNHGNFIVSLGALCAWLAPQAEALGVEIYPGFAAAELLFSDDDGITGVRIGDMGIARDGSHKATYTQGIDIRARMTILAEGCRGHLSKGAIKRYRLDADCDPQTYGIGMKELWQVPEGRTEPGLIQHSIGWPLDGDTYGGSFVYHIDRTRLAVGFVVGLDYSDPKLMPFEVFQQFKHHPSIKPLLEGGSVLSAGARAIVEGGWQSLPRVEMPGAMLIGDAAGTLNVPKIKGVHQAIRGGMLAARQWVEKHSSEGFDPRLRKSAIGRELRKVRNLRPAFRHGQWIGLAVSAWETVSAGLSPWTLHNHADHSALRRIDAAASPERDYVARDLPPRDRLQSVYFAATEHDEDQPLHLHILEPDVCMDRCRREYDNPCTRFCPAAVYERVEDEKGARLQINAANCVHCKTCDIKDPYQIIDWVTPEGGAGPNYRNL